jgi:formamidopyrimidine-DNA glycosylase
MICHSGTFLAGIHNMPELPEVETIRRNLLHGRDEVPPLVGRTITGVDLRWERTLAAPSPESFRNRITGQRITDIGRRGKNFLFRLSPDTMIIHLRMSGDLLIRLNNEPPAPHDRLLIFMEDGLVLAFNDTRKFGRVWLTDDPDGLLSHLGPEPLDSAFTPELFYDLIRTRRRQLKPLLLDQTFLAGMGNIYTDEALHLAGLHPQTLANSLTFGQVERLRESIRHVLEEGIRLQGASIDWVYRGGDFQTYFQVHRRLDEPCKRCGTPIKRIIVGQRSTYYCPNCQPAPETDGRT